MKNIRVVPFLSLNGKAAEAIAFYEKIFKAETVFKITHKEIHQKMDSSYHYLPGKKDWIAHSVLQIGQSQLMIADDIMSEQPLLTKGNNFSLAVFFDDFDSITQVYQAVEKTSGTKVIIELKKNEFAYLYAIVADPFGGIIQLTYEKEM